MASISPNNRPLPDFLGIPWGASQDEARQIMSGREGVAFNADQSGTSNLIFHGGVFANKDVRMWVLQFFEDQLHTAKILIAPPPTRTIDEFQDLAARFNREYGEPAHSGIIISPPYREGQEMEAIAAGNGFAAALYAFGYGSEVEGSILCQVAPNGQIVITYQHQRLNVLAMSSQKGLDAPVEGMPTMQPQSAAERGGCFIATATLADPHHPALYVLRRYRDVVLLSSAIGRAFVRLYYATAPFVARRIEGRPRLRSAAYRRIVNPMFRHALRRMRMAKISRLRLTK